MGCAIDASERFFIVTPSAQPRVGRSRLELVSAVMVATGGAKATWRAAYQKKRGHKDIPARRAT